MITFAVSLQISEALINTTRSNGWLYGLILGGLTVMVSLGAFWYWQRTTQARKDAAEFDALLAEYGEIEARLQRAKLQSKGQSSRISDFEVIDETAENEPDNDSDQSENP